MSSPIASPNALIFNGNLVSVLLGFNRIFNHPPLTRHARPTYTVIEEIVEGFVEGFSTRLLQDKTHGAITPKTNRPRAGVKCGHECRTMVSAPGRGRRKS
jgi:hypothetical protein